MTINAKDSNVAREMKENPKRYVAVVGLVNKVNEILLIQTSRFPDHWQPIGGGMDPLDSSPIETLVREVKEEVNISLSKDVFKFEITTQYDFGEGEVYFYTARLDKGLNLEFDDDEIKSWQWFLIKDALLLQMFPATKKFLEHLLNEGFNKS
jgi:8-oxo-dGTP pyrophosphatase MutT (NUDIX family)